MNFLEWLLQPIFNSLNRIEHNQEVMMATYTEVKQEWVDYTQALQAENADLRTALTDAQAAAAENAQALADFQADDAATDAQQLADAAQAIADDLQSTLDGLKEPLAEPEPLPDPPHVDNTLPGDLPE
jgi:regulator of replication initiation timing